MTTDTAPDVDVSAADSLAKIHFRVASVVLLIGVLAGLVLAIELSAPEFLNTGPFSYGRLQPIFTGSLLFGWLTVGLTGAIYYLLPRLTGGPLLEEPLARLSLLLVAGGTVLGLVAVASGGNQGLPIFEFPFYADIVLIVGLAGLIMGPKIFQGAAMHPQAATWSYGYLTMVVILAPAVMDSIGGDSASLKFWDRMIMFGGTTLYAVIAVYVVDAFRPAGTKSASA